MTGWGPERKRVRRMPVPATSTAGPTAAGRAAGRTTARAGQRAGRGRRRAPAPRLTKRRVRHGLLVLGDAARTRRGCSARRSRTGRSRCPGSCPACTSSGLRSVATPPYSDRMSGQPAYVALIRLTGLAVGAAAVGVVGGDLETGRGQDRAKMSSTVAGATRCGSGVIGVGVGVGVGDGVTAAVPQPARSIPTDEQRGRKRRCQAAITIESRMAGRC